MAWQRVKTGAIYPLCRLSRAVADDALTARRRPGSIAPMRPSRLLVLLLAVLAAAVWIAPAGSAAVKRVTCPLDAKAAANGPVLWAFSQYGAPIGTHKGLSKSYTHGRGTWLGKRAHGWICHQDMGGGVAKKRHLVLRTTATDSALHGRVTRLGKLGVELVIPLQVTATDDVSCAIGTRATMTLFASYYDVHVDRAALRFDAGCRKHDHTWLAPQLKLQIQRKGNVQVDGP